ncbi:MAG: hypothetical protein WC815_22870 [Vicinamibacterales bacterium]|jgi:hypothetical protein
MAINAAGVVRVIVGVLMLAAALPAAGQKTTTRSLANEPGTWRPWTCNGLSPSDLKILGFTLADTNAFKTRLQHIADLFRASPVWNPPMGVDPSLSGSLFGPSAYSPSAKKLKNQPIGGTIMMGSFEHYEVIRTTGGQERRERYIGDETPHIMLDVNWLPRGSGVNMPGDEDGEFFLEPVRTAEIGGFPAYGDMLVITKNGRPIWTPVSRERYLKAFIAKRRPDAVNAERYIADQQRQYDAFVAPAAAAARQAKYQAAIDKMAPKGAAAVEHERRYWERDEADAIAGLKKAASRDLKVSALAGVLAGLKAAEDQLAAMTPAERGGAACLLEDTTDATGSGLVAMATPRCLPLVTRNPDFFDPQLPRSVPQIIVAHRFRPLEKTWKEGRPTGDKKGNLDVWTTYEVFRQTDWQKLADQIGK